MIQEILDSGWKERDNKVSTPNTTTFERGNYWLFYNTRYNVVTLMVIDPAKHSDEMDGIGGGQSVFTFMYKGKPTIEAIDYLLF